MIVKTSEFVGSFVDWAKCPTENLPEYAFIGRSNVGKSSLINMLVSRKGLAKVSKTPGKTQTINFFRVNNEWFLVDLPGYGYAQVSQTQRKAFEGFVKNYLLNRPNLLCVFALIDSRLEPQTNDLEFLENLATNGIPFVMVFTKTDKLSQNKFQENIEIYKNKMLENWEELPQMFFTSSSDRTGKEELLNFIEQINLKF